MFNDSVKRKNYENPNKEPRLKDILENVEHQKNDCGKKYKLIEGNDSCVIILVYSERENAPNVSNYFDLKKARNFRSLESVKVYNQKKRKQNLKEKIMCGEAADNVQIYVVEYFERKNSL